MVRMPITQNIDIKSFLGLRKITVIYVVTLLLVLTWMSTLYQIYEIQHLAERNSTAVGALCVFRADLIQRRDANQRYLDLSPRQRKQKFGDLSNVPISVIKTNLATQNRTIASLDSLRCH